ncbi:cation:proton antiporter [Ketobacter sp.]|uniref:cation:proton antiporter n=1 Tax=Ketobacter sp. TaxID=2083498 RepID=UPI000F145931|nr:cation:proton antiporter [Ketobacter sp.]RLT97456.1 MAG: sodium:proton antiporter [Ketobacter sp.]
MYENLTLIGGFLLVYSLVAGGVERTRVSGPIIFTAFGLLIGPMVFDLHSMEIDGDVICSLAEVTLAVVLFTDAAGADVRILKRFGGIPARMLLIGLPLTILLGVGVAVLLIEDQPILLLALLATMLAPTDAALGKAVVSNKAIPSEIRESLNVESGLNDGICVPILLAFLELAHGASGEAQPLGLVVKLLVEEIGIGLAVGLGVTWIAVKLFRSAQVRGWSTKTWMQLSVAALAITCFSLAQYLGGSGFIAAFAGGLLVAFMGHKHAKVMHEEVLVSSEGASDALALVTWVLFGSAVVGQLVEHLTWLILLYSILSLTVIRMVPVFVSLWGSGVDTEGKLFLGWFGPRGLASIVFMVLIVNSGMPDTGPLVATASCTIVLSILAHGITANPWARGYARRRSKVKA